MERSESDRFVAQHREDDVRQLALRRAPDGIDLTWCLQQIEGWQLARKKLPTLWASTEGVWFPPRLSLEQCSSEQTANYKRKIAERLLPHANERKALADMTGGLGVDFVALASLFQQATYMEVLPHLCELARHNFPLLGLDTETLRIVNAAAGERLMPEEAYTMIFVDPARRDIQGRKTVAIGDCTPDLTRWQDEWLNRCQWMLVKLSPMLDIRQALRELHGVREVHIVSVDGECKELLFACSSHADSEEPTCYCVNLGTTHDALVCKMDERHVPTVGDVGKGLFLYEPNASILKGGVQDRLCETYSVRKLHPQSHLFVSEQPIPNFPGRRFRITDWSDFGKRNLRTIIGDLQRANLTVRNFPTPVAVLRKQLHLAEGGDTYLFATTAGNGQHILIRCERAE